MPKSQGIVNFDLLTMINETKQDYEFIDPPAIKAFLLANALLIDLLLETIGKIECVFGLW
jgi:hypothetical protein